MKKIRLVIIDLLLFILSLFVFWIASDQSDALGFSVIFLVVLNPLCIMFCSCNIGMYDNKKVIDYVFPLFFGLSYVLLDYFTFILANMIANNLFELPNLIITLAGIAISYFGFGIGILIKLIKNKRKNMV